MIVTHGISRRRPMRLVGASGGAWLVPPDWLGGLPDATSAAAAG